MKSSSAVLEASVPKLHSCTAPFRRENSCKNSRRRSSLVFINMQQVILCLYCCQKFLLTVVVLSRLQSSRSPGTGHFSQRREGWLSISRGLIGRVCADLHQPLPAKAHMAARGWEASGRGISGQAFGPPITPPWRAQVERPVKLFPWLGCLIWHGSSCSSEAPSLVLHCPWTKLTELCPWRHPSTRCVGRQG